MIFSVNILYQSECGKKIGPDITYGNINAAEVVSEAKQEM